MKAKTIWACVLLSAILIVNTFGQSRASRAAGSKPTSVSSEQTGDGISGLTSRIADAAIRDVTKQAAEKGRRDVMLLIGLGAGVVFAATVVAVLARRRRRANSP